MLARKSCYIACVTTFLMTRIAVPLTLPSSIPSLTQPATPSVSGVGLSILNESQPITCTRKQDWFSPRFNSDDCDSALLYLYMEEMYSVEWREKALEFLDAGATMQTKLQYQVTPMKFTFRRFSPINPFIEKSRHSILYYLRGTTLMLELWLIVLETCTIGIVMTGHFTRVQLPGVGKGERLLSDVGTWEEIWATAESVYNRCGKGVHRPGWSSTGKALTSYLLILKIFRENAADVRVFFAFATGDNNSIGVFFWSTDSQISKTVENERSFLQSGSSNSSVAVS